MTPIVRVTLDIRTDADPARLVLSFERYFTDNAVDDEAVVAASGKRLEAGEPQEGEHVG